MLFVERPITVAHIRHFCDQFKEGLRVEYKSTFDQSVRDKLPKVVSSFANSQGGVIVIGVHTQLGAPEPPFEGFEPAARDEIALTIENICLTNIHPPLLPSITVVPSDVAQRVFLIIEVEESGQAPHAIENSKKVYVRTGNAANPYDLADVSLIIDLLRRRQEPLELRNRLVSHAEGRSLQVVPHNNPDLQVSVCPTYPRNELCTSQDTWNFLTLNQQGLQYLIPYNSLRRVPDGTASLISPNPPATAPHYFELNKYGLVFATRQFLLRPWAAGDPIQQLHFGDLLHTLMNVLVCARLFYTARGYRGSVTILSSLHRVLGQVMSFRQREFMGGDAPDEFRCYTNEVSTERLAGAQADQDQRAKLFTDILAELTWPFWQNNFEYPRAELERNLRPYFQHL